MITLPDEPTLGRGALRAHWLALWTAAGLVGVAMPWGRHRPRPATTVLLAGAGATVGVVHPPVARPSRTWWDRMSRRVADRAVTHASRVMFDTAMPAGHDPDFATGTDAPPPRWQTTPNDPARDPRPAAGATLPAGHLGVTTLRELGAHRPVWLATCLAALRLLQDPAAPAAAAAHDGESYTLY